MKYAATRIIKGFDNFYHVQGQNTNTLNWETIEKHNDKKEAEKASEKYAKQISKINNCYIPFYWFNGYGKAYYKGEIYQTPLTSL